MDLDIQSRKEWQCALRDKTDKPLQNILSSPIDQLMHHCWWISQQEGSLNFHIDVKLTFLSPLSKLQRSCHAQLLRNCPTRLPRKHSQPQHDTVPTISHWDTRQDRFTLFTWESSDQTTFTHQFSRLVPESTCPLEPQYLVLSSQPP